MWEDNGCRVNPGCTSASGCSSCFCGDVILYIVAAQPFSTCLAAESVCHGASRPLRRRVIGPRSWVGPLCCSKTLTLADRLETQNTELRLTKIDGDTWLEPDRFPKIVADRERFESLISVMFSVFLAHQRDVLSLPGSSVCSSCCHGTSYPYRVPLGAFGGS